MQITVVGHICFDIIKYPDGKENQSYGGIFYTVAALANLLGQDDVVIPVFGVGKSDYDEVISLLNKYGNVDTSAIYRMNGKTNQVTLTYQSDNCRVECSKNISEEIPIKKIRPTLSSDMIIINMISGFDISLETLDEIRIHVREENKPIYMDIHCLVCGVNPDFTRFYRPLEGWRRWLFMLHGVQMNEKEAKALTNEFSDENILASHILALNTNVLHITRGERGSTIYVNEHKNVKRYDFNPIKPEKAVDTTGCGDVYAAAYSVSYLKWKDIIKASSYANEVASFNAQFPGSSGINELSKFKSKLL